MSDSVQSSDPNPREAPPPAAIGKEVVPSLQDLAPLIGMLNTQKQDLNNHVVGDSALRVQKTGVEEFKRIANIPQPVAPVQPPAPINPQQIQAPPPVQPAVHTEIVNPYLNKGAPPIVPISPAPVQSNKPDNYDKKHNTLKRKVTKLETEIQCMKDVISFDYKVAKYSVESDSFTGTCNNTKTLLNIILKELQSGSKSVTILKV